MATPSQPDGAQRVALLLNLQTGYCRRAVLGIASFGYEHGWVMEELPAQAEILDSLRRWRPSGIIAHILDHEFGKAVLSLGIPTVSISSIATGLPMPLFDSDHQAVGEMAAEYLWHRGARQFGFFGSAEAQFSIARQKGFEAYLEKFGREVSTQFGGYSLRPPFDADIAKTESELASWVTGLKKPAAVFCSNDEHGRLLSMICRQLGIAVPKEVMLLGVDDDKMMCSLANPPLSSVDNPAEEIGYRAAKTLQAMMAGDAEPPPSDQVRPLRVVTRASTDLFVVDDRQVARALDYIKQRYADQELSVDAIAERCGISRRSLERRFSDSLGETILATVQRTRVEHAKRLLRMTSTSVDQIASVVGFSNHRRFGIVFRQFTELTPSEFRNFYLSDKPTNLVQ